MAACRREEKKHNAFRPVDEMDVLITDQLLTFHIAREFLTYSLLT